MSKVDFSFTQLAERQERSVVAEYVRVDSANAPVEIWAGQRFLATLGKGSQVRTDKFSRIAVVNTVAGVNDVVLSVGEGELVGSDVAISSMPPVEMAGSVSIDDATPVRTEIVEMPAISVSATVNKSNWVNSFDDLVWAGSSRKAIASASGAHVEIMLKNPSWSDGHIRIGGSGVSATSGFALEPGESVICTCEGSLYGWADDGAVLTRSILRIV